MFTQTEIISPLLSKKEYIALEIAKVLIADKNYSHAPVSAAQAASKAAHALIECCKKTGK